jgi:2-hydroxychromene-2-carboxylate isomerase/predicted thioesterase
MKQAQTGAALTTSFEVSDADTAAAIGNVGVHVVSTMTLVKLVEVACYNVIQPMYECGDATVGTRVALDHVGPAHPGRAVDIHATVTGHEGRRLEFDVEVTQDGRPVMRGQHHRVVVSTDKFASGAAAASPDAQPHVEFWFDVHSPWCYFASYRIGNLVREHGGTIKWRPVHLPKLMDLIEGRRPLEANENFVRWFRQDIVDHAALHGLPFDQHKDYPLRPARALRSFLHAEEAGAAEPYVQAMMTAYWSQQKDISDIDVLAALGERVGLDGRDIRAAVDNETYKATIDANVREAAERGLFGVPAMFFNGKLFWGNDRLDLLDRNIGAWRAQSIRRKGA